MTTPVIRCNTQDHMPGSPRYSDRVRSRVGATSVVLAIECSASNIIDGRDDSEKARMIVAPLLVRQVSDPSRREG
ncbi:hypothetical protein GCM10007304_29150 [Rhodococcoides trifolii]|uniref:Uncharacterized protein n=1 Tax=Rhodococcoides trifolii TaxID=908250 RepID=A0A917D730_9NOCA|nr:hypothetical protein GCM10007304_29150 [Rhodococcus trifolii]